MEDYVKDQVPCWLTYTTMVPVMKYPNNAPVRLCWCTWEGPRYCPSIEDKICMLHYNVTNLPSLSQKDAIQKKYMFKGFQPLHLKMYSVS